MYRIIRDAAIREDLVCERETQVMNTTDMPAVACKNDGVIIGHLPRRISGSCSLFLRRGSSIAYQQSLCKIMMFYFFVIRKFRVLNFRRGYARRNFYYAEFFWIYGLYMYSNNS